MFGPEHRIVGAVSWVATAQPLLGVNHLGPWFGGLAICAAASHGGLSPDMDQRRPLCRWVRHRGVTHFWLWPAALLLASLYYRGWWWVGLAVAVAWLSHDLADAVFGHGGRGRPDGVPWLPKVRGGWQYLGVGFKADGVPAKVTAWLLLPGFAVWLMWPYIRALRPFMLG